MACNPKRNYIGASLQVQKCSNNRPSREYQRQLQGLLARTPKRPGFPKGLYTGHLRTPVPKLYLVWCLEPESLNGQYMDPVGLELGNWEFQLPRASK